MRNPQRTIEGSQQRAAIDRINTRSAVESDLEWPAELEACSGDEEVPQIDIDECERGVPTFSGRAGHSVVTGCSRIERVLGRAPTFA